VTTSHVAGGQSGPIYRTDKGSLTISDSTIAIIGTGNIGGRLAANFAAGGQDFLLAARGELMSLTDLDDVRRSSEHPVVIRGLGRHVLDHVPVLDDLAVLQLEEVG
jgi:phosphoglycerate dehydrogenase-like enzyme